MVICCEYLELWSFSRNPIFFFVLFSSYFLAWCKIIPEVMLCTSSNILQVDQSLSQKLKFYQNVATYIFLMLHYVNADRLWTVFLWNLLHSIQLCIHVVITLHNPGFRQVHGFSPRCFPTPDWRFISRVFGGRMYAESTKKFFTMWFATCSYWTGVVVVVVYLHVKCELLKYQHHFSTFVGRKMCVV